MTKRITSPVSFFLALCLVLAFPASSSAGSVMITKGSTLLQGNLEGLVTLPGGLVLSRMEIDVASWGVNYRAEDFVVYDPAMAVCSRYEEALIVNLPGLSEVLTSVDGKSGTLGQFLEQEPYVIYDTDLRMIGIMGLYPSGAPYPLPSTTPPDTTAPNTVITSGPSGTITEKDVTFTFSGSDNTTSRSNLVYACFLDGYDASWSGYSSTTTKTYSNLPNGSYAFSVRAKDEAQNVDGRPASQAFTVAYVGGYGDVNNDGNVDLLDAVSALKVCVGIEPAEEVNANADVDGDGKIGMAEVIYILQKAAKLR
jgi:hypothetical protein